MKLEEKEVKVKPLSSILKEHLPEGEEIDLMNEAKELAEEVGILVQKMKALPSNDQRWIATGATDLQKGFMCIIRGVAQPTTF